MGTLTPLYWTRTSGSGLLPHFLRDFGASGLLTAVIFVASCIFKSSIFTSGLCATGAHLATRFIKKIFNNFSFMQSLEKLSLALLRKAPYAYVVVAIIALIFVWFLPPVSGAAATCGGILSGLTIEVHSDREHNGRT